VPALSENRSKTTSSSEGICNRVRSYRKERTLLASGHVGWWAVVRARESSFAVTARLKPCRNGETHLIEKHVGLKVFERDLELLVCTLYRNLYSDRGVESDRHVGSHDGR